MISVYCSLTSDTLTRFDIEVASDFLEENGFEGVADLLRKLSIVSADGQWRDNTNGSGKCHFYLANSEVSLCKIRHHKDRTRNRQMCPQCQFCRGVLRNLGIKTDRPRPLFDHESQCFESPARQ